jgi:Tfp pilus assembly protein PilO
MRERTPEEQLCWLSRLLHLGGALLTALLLSLIGLALFAPIGRELVRCETALEELEAQLAKSPAVRREHRQVRDELVRLRAQKAMLRERITDGPCEDEFLRQVSSAAESARLQLREYRPGNSEVQGDYGSMTIHLEGEGGHANICQFLDELARLPRLSKVQRVQVTSSHQSITYPVSLAVEIFFAAHPASPNSTEKPRARRAS